jgi:aspartate carbamoyltransferase catalytic subunit
MMDIGTHITAAIAAAALAAGGVVGASSGDGSGVPPRKALVIDAAAARDGRDLVDSRLEAAHADVRLPRTAAEARTNVRYLAELGRRVVVAGPKATAAAEETGVAAVKAHDLSDALAAAGR